jgi:hypothetical protein
MSGFEPNFWELRDLPCAVFLGIGDGARKRLAHPENIDKNIVFLNLAGQN